MDPVVQGALIAALSAISAGGLATAANVYLESRRQAAQDKRDEATRHHEERQARYAERKSVYEDFYAVISSAEQSTLELEARTGALPGDMGYDSGHQKVDDALLRIQFHASDDVLAAAEACTNAFYAWGWGNGTHTDLYNAMNEFVRAVRADLGMDALSRKRPVPVARRKKRSNKELPRSTDGD